MCSLDHPIWDIIKNNVTENNLPAVISLYQQAEQEHKKKVAYEAFYNLQKDIGPVIKNARNEHVKYNYATLGAYLDALREPLNKHKFVMQSTVVNRNTTQISSIDRDTITIKTMIIHENGYEISTEGIYPADLKGKSEIQAYGSTISYGIRYNLVQMFSLPSVDTDGANITEIYNQEQAVLPYSKTDIINKINRLITLTKTDKQQFLSWLQTSNLENLSMLKLSGALMSLYQKLENLSK